MTAPERILFVTGRLAEASLRDVLPQISARKNWSCEVAVLPITVAALMQVGWLQRKLVVPPGISRVVLPGWCQGDLATLEQQFGVPFTLGPKDLFDLPEFFQSGARPRADLSRYQLEILAEINHAPRLSTDSLLAQAARYRQDGADVIDVGCIPGESWRGVRTAVRALIAEGHRVSIDSFDRAEVEAAVDAGATLVLSCHRANREWAATIPAEFVVIPETPAETESLDETAAFLAESGRPFRLDPILEPIGFGFGHSLARYAALRERNATAPMMMGVGNVTELTEVDSAGINFLLAGFCEEFHIGSVLTTEVSSWCRTSVKELDVARRVVHHSITRKVLPKYVDDSLVMLRGGKPHVIGDARLMELSGQVTDPNFRIFAERGEVHIFNRDGYWRGDDPYEILDRILSAGVIVDNQHAFYLGYELCKARTAITLGKSYKQDESLRWGFLTSDETSAVARRHAQAKQQQQQRGEGGNE